jgi:cytochrome c oxidase subunit 2
MTAALRSLLLLPLALAPLPAAARLAERLQSAVDPRGAAAADLATLWWVMFVGAVLIFVGVMALVLLGTLRPRASAPARLLIIGGGLVFPAVTLTLLLVYTVNVGARLMAPPPDDALTIDVTGHMWWWDVRYRGAGGEPELVTANELRIPVGRPVHLRVRSNDVIHSFWVPSLAGKIDMIPGRTNVITFQADAPGTYRGQCAEFCGLQHAQMALHVVAEEPAAWEDWFERQRRLGATGERFLTPRQQRGRDVFVDAGCGSCHALRGVSDPPAGLAPDLTLVGARPSLGAGTLPNSVGHLAAWIAGSQSIKPGNRMPSFHTLDGPSLTALADFLAAQK